MPHDTNTAVLKITDGTNSADLLYIREGVSVESWRQAVAQYRNSGTFQESSLADGRRLVDKKFDNVREVMPLKVGERGQRGNPDNAALVLQEMFALFEKAAAFWATDWQFEPVWLESRANCETNTKYAHVVTATIPELDDIYSTRFNRGSMDDLALVIERGHWLGTPPATSTATEISAVETYDGRNLGNVDSAGTREPTTSGVYVTNLRLPYNLTHAFTWSAANGFSANLMDAALPFDLIDDVGAAPQVNDYVVFGIEAVAGAYSEWFRSLVFDIGTAQTGLSLTWELYTGAWGAPTSIIDNTATAQPFDTAGINSVHWVGVALGVTPQTLALNGVTAFWIRARVTAVPGPLVTPTQQNRDVYTITWPYTEIQADEIGGDIPAIARIKLTDVSHDAGGAGGTEDLYYNRVMLGLRSQSRGENFTAILNGENTAGTNPSGVTLAAGANTAFGASIYAPVEHVANLNAPGATAMSDRLTYTFDTSISPEYYGTFRALAVFGVSTGPVDIITQLRVRLGSGGQTFTNPVSVTWGAFQYIVADYGKVEIPGPGILTTADPITMEIAIQIETTGAVVMSLDELILMPVDEWAIDATDVVNDPDSPVEEGRLLDIDSIMNPKTPLRSLCREVATDEVTAIYLSVKNGPAILQANSLQRLWCFLMRSETAGSSSWLAPIQTSALIEIQKNQRYLGPRGAQ